MKGCFMYGRRSIEEIVDMKVRAWEFRQAAEKRRQEEAKKEAAAANTNDAPKTQTFKITKVSP